MFYYADFMKYLGLTPSREIPLHSQTDIGYSIHLITK